MTLTIKDVPLNTRLAPKTKQGPKPETIRKKAGIVLKEYDADNYIAGLKRGATYVKKFLVGKYENDALISTDEVEKRIRAMVLAGDFDTALIKEYEKRKKSKSTTGTKRRGRPPKNK